jgi:osmoprotectant transport system substrate-binding protein
VAGRVSFVTLRERQMAKVFISYRRADSAMPSGRIYDRLVAKFGRRNMFKDVDDIPAGVNFGAYIQESLQQCAVALVIIGGQWLGALAANGGRRLDDPNDWVRVEIETALSLELTVIPLLIEGASMPTAADLPTSLQQLAQINGLQVRNDPDFARDMDRVIAAVERAFASHSSPARISRRAGPLPVPASPPVASPAASPASQIAQPAKEEPSRSVTARIRRRGPLLSVLATVMLVGVLAALLYWKLPLGASGSPPGRSSGNGPGAGVTLAIGSKQDADGQLLGAMYGLLLAHQGYTVTYQLGAGDTTFLDSAIKSAAIDLYPEFTGTALNLYRLSAPQDPQQLYSTVKNYYEQQFKLTWLTPAYSLNDSYAICTSQENATKYNLKSNADLAAQNGKLKIGSQDDGVQAAIDPVQQGYGVSFKQVVSLTEQLSFTAVKNGDADLMVCYSTDPAIVSNNFVMLTDPKGVFPIYNPAPVVRDSVLTAYPTIQTTLDALESHLATDKQVALVKKVSLDTQDPKVVAKAFLQSEGLLPVP